MSVPTNVYDVHKFCLTNSSASDLELWLEPLGDRVMIPAGATCEVQLEVHLTAQPSDCLTIAISDKKATLYGWLQSICLVSGDGRQTRIWPNP
jgi:hypothetical protein